MAKMPEITVKWIDVERLALAMEKVDGAVRRVQAAGGQPGFEGWTGYAALIAAEYVEAVVEPAQVPPHAFVGEQRSPTHCLLFIEGGTCKQPPDASIHAHG